MSENFGFDLYRTLFNAAGDSIIVCSVQGVAIDCNQAAVELFACTQAQLIGSSPAQWSPEFQPDGRRSDVAAADLFGRAKAGEVVRFAWVNQRADGLPISVDVTVRFVNNEDTDLFVVISRDMTLSKQVEAALEESRERYRGLSEAAFETISISENGICLEQNAQAERMFGYTLAEAIGRAAIEWIAPQDRDLVWKNITSGNEQPYQATCLRKDGSTFTAILRGKMMHYRNREVRVTSISDITALKHAEAALKESEERWKFAIEGAGDGLWDWNMQTGKAYYSSRYKAMLGFAEDEIGDSADEWSKRIHPDDAPGVYAALQPYLDGKPGSAAVEFRMLCKNGSWQWTMGRGMVVQRDADGKPLRMIGTNSDITERKAHEDKLKHIAHFDALTNLPNRVLLADRMQQAITQAQRRQHKLAVAYLDLDGFKAINDHHGHAIGDQVLITLAKRMREALREGDTLARLGGDEFVAVLIDLEDPTDSEPMLNRLLAASALPVPVGELTLQISASLGVTFYPQAQDMDADQLLRQADQAMYHAKLAGKSRYHVFDAAQDTNMRVHHESLERIRLALAQHEFVLHYQPKVNMRRGQVIGAEALIRWQHPEKGLLAPGSFLPVIEDHPLAVEVGEWVIDTAMRQMATWHAAGLDLPVSVNIGARQLQQGDFMPRLRAILARHPQVNPAHLELEVLETSALADMVQVAQVIEDCAKIGVKFALDDFGTGYSSLTYLKRLRVALLKIDQSFVRDMLDDPDDLAILKGVIGLAAAFKRQVIAEGVETVPHGTALLQLGCELAQGYGIARPMPPERMPHWAATWQPDAAWCAMP